MHCVPFIITGIDHMQKALLFLRKPFPGRMQSIAEFEEHPLPEEFGAFPPLSLPCNSASLWFSKLNDG